MDDTSVVLVTDGISDSLGCCGWCLESLGLGTTDSRHRDALDSTVQADINQNASGPIILLPNSSVAVRSAALS